MDVVTTTGGVHPSVVENGAIDRGAAGERFCLRFGSGAWSCSKGTGSGTTGSYQAPAPLLQPLRTGVRWTNLGEKAVRDYLQLGQASRFVRPGAYRIASTSPLTHYKGSGLGCRNSTSYGSHTVDDVAFRNPDGAIVLLTYNAAPSAKPFTVRWHGDAFSYTLPPRGTATFTWQSR